MARNADTLRQFLVETFCDVDVFLDAMRRDEVELFAPDIVYEDANLPDHIGELYEGHERVLKAAERWREGAEVITLTLDEVIGEGDDLVSVHQLHTQTEGIELAGPVAYHWRFGRQGRPPPVVPQPRGGARVGGSEGHPRGHAAAPIIGTAAGRVAKTRRIDAARRAWRPTLRRETLVWRVLSA